MIFRMMTAQFYKTTFTWLQEKTVDIYTDAIRQLLQMLRHTATQAMRNKKIFFFPGRHKYFKLS